MRKLPDDPEELKEIIRSMETQTKAWWEIQSQNQGELKTLIMDGIKGYLRTCRSGGMTAKQSNLVEAVVDGVADRIAFIVWPIILRIAEKHHADLIIPVAWEREVTDEEKAIEFLEKATQDPALRDTRGYTSVLMAMSVLDERKKRL